MTVSMRVDELTDEHIGMVILGAPDIGGWEKHLLLQGVNRRDDGVELLFRWNDDPSPQNSQRGKFAIGMTFRPGTVVRVKSADTPVPRGRIHKGCDHCSAMWDDGWVDLIVPDATWALISPNSTDGESGGYLCAHCLTTRLVEKGLTDVPVRAFGKPFWIGVA